MFKVFILLFGLNAMSQDLLFDTLLYSDDNLVSIIQSLIPKKITAKEKEKLQNTSNDFFRVISNLKQVSPRYFKRFNDFLKTTPNLTSFLFRDKQAITAQLTLYNNILVLNESANISVEDFLKVVGPIGAKDLSLIHFRNIPRGIKFTSLSVHATKSFTDDAIHEKYIQREGPIHDILSEANFETIYMNGENLEVLYIINYNFSNFTQVEKFKTLLSRTQPYRLVFESEFSPESSAFEFRRPFIELLENFIQTEKLPTVCRTKLI